MFRARSLALAAITSLLLAALGCTLITEVDRSKISPDGSAGAPGDEADE
jgi:hypothetical protein